MQQERRTEYLAKMYQVIGAAMEVYNELGFGYSEPIYQECLSIVCTERSIPWEREKLLPMYFRNTKLKKEYKADFVCFGDLIVELKAVSELLPDHRAQLFNYLRITRLYGGLLINFGQPNSLVSERYLYNVMTEEYDFVSSKKFL